MPKVGMFIRIVSLSPSVSARGSAAADDVAEVRADVVDEAVLQRLFCAEPAVAVAIRVDLLDGLAGLGSGDLGEAALHVEDQLRLGLDVARSAAEAAVRLVQQHARVGRD